MKPLTHDTQAVVFLCSVDGDRLVWAVYIRNIVAACAACGRLYCLHGLRSALLLAWPALYFSICAVCNRLYCLHGLQSALLLARPALYFSICMACNRLYCLHGLRFTSLFARPERPASTQPRASEAAPWVGSAREPTPYRGKSVVVRFAGYEYFCPFRAWLQLPL